MKAGTIKSTRRDGFYSVVACDLEGVKHAYIVERRGRRWMIAPDYGTVIGYEFATFEDTKGEALDYIKWKHDAE